MFIGVPDTLTIDNSGNYIMSIRLRSGGLSFSGYDPSARGSFFYREVEFDRSVSFISSLKDFFFANEFFSWNYKRVNLVLHSRDYTVAPNNFIVDGDEMKLLSFCRPVAGKHCLTNSFGDDSSIIYALDEEVYEFCVRSLASPLFVHHLSSLYSFLLKYQPVQNVRRLYAVVDDGILDILSFSQNGVAFSNTYSISQPTDILYFILYIWKELAMDVETDELFIMAASPSRVKLIEGLAPYLRNIKPIELPAEAFLLGYEASKAPIDLISLYLCE